MNHSNVVANCNIADRLCQQASARPDAIAVATPLGKYAAGRYKPLRDRPYRTISFDELSQKVNRIAAGLQRLGMKPGDRIVLLVRFGEDFITLVFALLKVGVTLVLIDPGMPRKHLLASLESVNPNGFVAIPQVHFVVKIFASRFRAAVKNVTVGPTFGLLPKPTFAQLTQSHANTFIAPSISASDPAAIIFTTGSTGPPKGVLYTQQTFNSQVDQLIEHYGIEPGGIDLACFPLFGLFDAVMGTTTVIPDMNPIRPAEVDPPRLLDAIDQWQINQAFGSPALWRAVGRYCDATGRQCPSLRFVLSAGAPVTPQTLMSMRQMMHPDGKMFTPYGMTEALPIASIESREVLGETASLTEAGRGTCVGRKFSGIEWKLIEISDEPISQISSAKFLGPNLIGELIVSGPVVSKQYITRANHNAMHKIDDDGKVWHRTGDVGYFDENERFWYCGRKSHRVALNNGETIFTEPCEAIINRHPQVFRSALVGVSTTQGTVPVVVVEPMDRSLYRSKSGVAKLLAELVRTAKGSEYTNRLEKFLIYPSKLPTDIRHNSKIFREQLQVWAQEKIS